MTAVFVLLAVAVLCLNGWFRYRMKSRGRRG